MNPFIVTYTNRCKDYCDTEFLDNLHKLSKGHPVMIVDNTSDDESYANRIRTLTKIYSNFSVHHIIVPREPIATLFHRNVTESVNLCRDHFLRSDCDSMLIVESDVIPPVNLLDTFKKDIREERYLLNNDHVWGIIGGLYYQGFHDYNLRGLNRTHHVLSGCSLYNRELIKKYPFRYDPSNLGPFPDAIICFDSGNDYSFWNDHDIICEHLNNPATGTRYSSNI